MTERATVHEIGRAGRPQVKKYVWADGSHHTVDAGKVAAEFKRLREAQIALTPKALVDAARPPDATLHPEAEWDDSVAADAYREQQMTAVMRHNMTVYEIKRDGKPEALPPQRTVIKLELRGAEQPFSDQVKEWVQPRVYAPLMEVMDDDEARRLYVRNAWFDLAALRRKYRDVAEFAAIFEKIDEKGRELGLAV